MAVYTSIQPLALKEWLEKFDLEELEDLKGISAGVTNTNYLISTKKNKYILTIFEHHEIHELPFYINLMSFLQKNKFRCPKPILSKNGKSLNLLMKKPALIVSFLDGDEVKNINNENCFSIGECLAQLHNVGKNFKEGKKNSRDLFWIKNKFQELKNNLALGNQKIIEAELNFLMNNKQEALPKGIIHGDLFRDNVLFSQKKGPGFIDFYYACNEVFVYDIAIAINDWCTNSDGTINNQNLDNFMRGYENIRPLEDLEHKFLLVSLRWAALRFFVSRLEHIISNPSAEILSIKNPNQFKEILIDRQNLKGLF